MLLVQGAARFVSRILLIMGCSWGGEASDADGDGTVHREAVLAPALDALLEFRCARRQSINARRILCCSLTHRARPRRDAIRGLARAGSSTQELLAACDRLRDVALPELGVRVDDSGTGAKWKLCDPEELRQEAARDAEARRVKEAALQAKREEAARKAAEKEAKARIPPEEMFKLGEHAGKFATYDAAGFPLTAADGQALSKGLQKKLQKAHELQAAAHEQWKAGTGAAAVE